MFKLRFQQQYWAIAILLNYTAHMNLARSKHLLPFYDVLETIYCILRYKRFMHRYTQLAGEE
jgi:hypothetical protein